MFDPEEHSIPACSVRVEVKSLFSAMISVTELPEITNGESPLIDTPEITTTTSAL
jgi:hypothetical protein